MVFPLDNILLGAPSYGPRKGTEGIVWHTTEGTDASRAAAEATARWQATPGATTGSYNWIIFDGGLLLTVPYLEASGGMATGVAPYWQPGRYPFLRQNLSPAAYADPNAFLLNVSFSGKAASFAAGKMPQNMIDTAAALTKWVEAQDWAGRLVHSGHMHWQTNRSDPSQQALDAIARAYGGDMAVLTRPVREKWKVPAATEFWTGGPESGDKKVFTAAVELWSNGETTDGNWRRFEYGSEELWLKRAGLTPIAGTRNPTAGYGAPVVNGFTAEDLAEAKRVGQAEGAKVGFIDAKTKAAVAVQGIK